MESKVIKLLRNFSSKILSILKSDDVQSLEKFLKFAV